MGKVNDLLVAESEKYVSSMLADNSSGRIIFHDLSRILELKRSAENVGALSGLPAEDMALLRLGALFLFSGCVRSVDRYHEESAAIAAAFLSGQGADQSTIDRVRELILATRAPQDPKDPVAAALCDATLMFTASGNALEQVDLLCDETMMNQPGLKRNAFEKGFVEFLRGHAFFTEYGRTVLQPHKEDLAQRISERMKRRKLVEGKKEDPGKNSIFYSRGVETMFRITARNQINLNSIADNKSNILISVNAIIISIIITMLAGNIGNMAQDIVPILVFLLICLTTIVIAILSTRPNIVTRKFTGEDLKDKNVDLIFFGNFSKMDFDEYLMSLKEMMKDDDHLYSTLIQNQYSLGKILSKKFRLVRIAYNVFMYGIIFTVIVFFVNYIITQHLI